MRLAAIAIAVMPALAAAACEGEVFGPGDVAAVSLDSLPFPAVVLGDTLRDASGAVAPLRAVAFNFRGEPLAGTEFRYIALERGVHVDSITGIVRGDSLRDTPVRVVASSGGLQTQAAQLRVVRRPDTLSVGTVDTIRYSLLDTAQNVGTVSVRVLNKESAAGVPFWLVSFQITYPADTSRARLVDEAGLRSTVDTTAADGTASRRVRISAAGLPAANDSVVVVASARHRGIHVAGSPRRLVVHLRPRSP